MEADRFHVDASHFILPQISYSVNPIQQNQCVKTKIKQKLHAQVTKDADASACYLK